MYPDPRVSEFVSKNFVTYRSHVKENPQGFERFGVQWTPTILIADSKGVERHRIEGFLPVDEFLPQVEFGLAKAAFASGDFGRAESIYRRIVDAYPNADVAPEAQYWAGVSKYKASNNPAALAETAKAFQSRYADSVWAKKSSVWSG